MQKGENCIPNYVELFLLTLSIADLSTHMCCKYLMCGTECTCRDASGGLETSPELAEQLITETDRGGREGGRQQQHQLNVRNVQREYVYVCLLPPVSVW